MEFYRIYKSELDNELLRKFLVGSLNYCDYYSLEGIYHAIDKYILEYSKRENGFLLLFLNDADMFFSNIKINMMNYKTHTKIKSFNKKVCDIINPEILKEIFNQYGDLGLEVRKLENLYFN